VTGERIGVSAMGVWAYGRMGVWAYGRMGVWAGVGGLSDRICRVKTPSWPALELTPTFSIASEMRPNQTDPLNAWINPGGARSSSPAIGLFSSPNVQRHADTPIRFSHTPIRRYAPTPIRPYADTFPRRADTPCQATSRRNAPNAEPCRLKPAREGSFRAAPQSHRHGLAQCAAGIQAENGAQG
jgi:hypothetical protein